MTIALLEHAEKLADEAGMEKPDGLLWALKSVKPDMRTYGNYRWPWPGNWVEAHDVDESNTEDPCPSRPGDGLCVGLTWGGMASGGIPAHTLLLVGYRQSDVLAASADKLRARAVYVRDVVDGARLVSNHGARAYLRGANLSNADLRGANLSNATLRGAYLRGANLSNATLRGAYLRGAYLRGADLRGAVADVYTTWSDGFAPAERGVVA